MKRSRSSITRSYSTTAQQQELAMSKRFVLIASVAAGTASLIFGGGGHNPKPRVSPYALEQIDPRLERLGQQADELADSINATVHSERPVTVRVLNGYVKRPHKGSTEREIRYLQPPVLDVEDSGDSVVKTVGIQRSGHNGEVEIYPLDVTTGMEIVLIDPETPFITISVRAFQDTTNTTHGGPLTSAYAVDPGNPNQRLSYLAGRQEIISATGLPASPVATIPE